ncbi:MAG: type II secretion system F family protein [Syntrophomonas sp.]|uniref:type II secretion system F family protein n=1 Tax=Syntrophomonas sp. TaxID=2053627 RepID=UPI002608C877|nr:type II secretion system F family protein [Syntrophomonas sp.]MDD2510223.1 type II secretion system F family protein [Syntrophomonas sp.]MDD3879978.1 type II secretion system F family protein [Syntrophomonas sp.]MDD4627162.1 type II secretion system F family protein [Syntrophomonas sp.]
MEFAYKVRNTRGKVLRARQEAEDRDALLYSLLQQDYFVISLREVHKSNPIINRDLFSHKVSSKEILIFTRQFLAMVAAGFSILRAFKIMGEVARKQTLKKALLQIHNDIEQGQALWVALSQHPKIFSSIYVHMIKAGEMGGKLETVLDSLGQHLEREQDINARIKAASIYPLIITLLALLVLFFIVSFIMPAFVNVFESAGAEIPLPTQVLFKLGLFLAKNWITLLLAFIAAFLLFKVWIQTSRGKCILDKVLLRLPLLGSVLSRIIVARFARIMATLLQAGIPILQALEVAAGVVGNVVVSQAIRRAGRGISEGESITYPLEATGIFDTMLTQMIAVGEESGSLDSMFARISDYYEQEVLYKVNILLVTIEPVMILFVALLVTGIVMATLLPVFDLMKMMA